MKRAALALAAILILLASAQEACAQQSPGSSCSTTGNWTDSMTLGGSGVFNGMFCNGGTFKGIINFESTGNVGIGTTSPQTLLHVYGTSNTAGIIIDGTTSPSLEFRNNGAVSAYVGLPTSSGSLSTDAAPGDLVIRTQNTSQRVLFNVNGGYGASMMALNNGNVGIGTTSPAAPLDVSGEVRVGSANTLACATGTKGAIRFNSSTTYMEYCNGSAWGPFEQPQCSTGSVAACWLPATRTSGDVNFTSANIVSGTSILGVTGTATASSSCPLPNVYSVESQPWEAGNCCNSPNNGAIWGNGTYIFVGTNDPEIAALSFNTSTHAWTYITKLTGLTGDVDNIAGDGTYIYAMENSGSSGTYALDAFTFNGSAFTKVGTTYTSVLPSWLYVYGGYIYLADTTNGLKALTFNGTTFTLKATYTTTGINAAYVWGDGTYIYLSDIGKNKMRAFTYSGGSSFTVGGTTTNWSATGPFMGDGTYIYVGDALATQNAVRAYTYNGSTFTQVASLDPAGYPGQTLTIGGYVYVGGSNEWRAYTFNGSTFTLKGNITTATMGNGVVGWSDGNYMYSPDGGDNGQSYDLSAMALCH